MQNRYVGDIADYGKHGLLRFLSGVTDEVKPEPKLRLGLIWYMHHDERHSADKTKINRDGKHTGYLDYTPKNLEEYAPCDRELWDTLGHLVGREARCVHCAQNAGLLPEDTLFYDAMLSYVPQMPKEQKVALRDYWLKCALRATKDAKLVCVDPDNGIGADRKKLDMDGPKFAYMSDLQALWERKQSLVVYQHIGRNGNAEDQIRAKVGTLRDGLGPEASPISLRFPSRVFYVVPRPGEEGELIKERVGRFLGGPWGNHFEWVA